MQHKTIAILKSKSNKFSDFCCHEWIESSFVQASQFNHMFRSSPFLENETIFHLNAFCILNKVVAQRCYVQQFASCWFEALFEMTPHLITIMT
jgi:hypothetical protein